MLSLTACLHLSLALIASTTCAKNSRLDSIGVNNSSKENEEKISANRVLYISSFDGRVDSANDFGEKVSTIGPPEEAVADSATTVDDSDVSDRHNRYESLAIVCAICAVIVLSIGLTVLYIQCKRGNNLSQDINGEGFQLDPIWLRVDRLNGLNAVNVDLDLMLGSHHLNRRVDAFNDISARIVTTRQNIKTDNKTIDDRVTDGLKLEVTRY